MNREESSKNKRKYQTFRHHAWAGLGFLSVVLAIRLIFIETGDVLTPVIVILVVILVIYIVIALIFTYKYRSGLSDEEQVVHVEPSVELEKERLKSEVEKERLKIEKKKAKAESKREKKAKK